MDIVFLDTETLGLHPDAPVWEFAAIRRPGGDPPRTEMTEHFTIRHDPGFWYETLPEAFRADYQKRYDRSRAYYEEAAAHAIHTITRGAKIIACNPGFDLERLWKLLRRNDIEPEWHYHPLDITSLAIGYDAGRGQHITAPWRSEQSAEAIGVATDDFARHTAMGDVLWTRAQWDAVMRP